MDKAHRQTDKILADMERKLRRIYNRAQVEIDKSAKEYFSEFKQQDDEFRTRVENGTMKKSEYSKWRKSEILYSKRFSAMKRQISANLSHINEIALAYINGELPEIYCINYNNIKSSLEHIGGYSFQLVNPETIRNLLVKDNTLLPMRHINKIADLKWNRSKINSEVLQGILQGESMDKIASRFMNVTNMNRNSAIRNARTSVTAAENKGRQDSYIAAEKDGIILTKRWVATHDRRTRDAHRLLNGQIVEIDKPFQSELGPIMYPADPAAKPANVYNCRCTTVAEVKGFRNER